MFFGHFAANGLPVSSLPTTYLLRPPESIVSLRMVDSKLNAADVGMTLVEGL